MENKLEKKQINVPGFMEKALETIEGMEAWAQKMIDSKLVPDHFYETKLVDNKKIPDYTRGNTAAVIVVVQNGIEIGISPAKSLQALVPIKGLISIKGDFAKALTISHPICEYWKEEEKGTIEDGDYTFTIKIKRKGGSESISSFSINDAKRAGLYFTDEELKNKPDWLKKSYPYSAWYKYPKRMIRYRCVGFISRDEFSDILNGLITYEEALDYPGNVVVENLDDKSKKPMKFTENKLLSISENSDNINSDLQKKLEDKTTENKIGLTREEELTEMGNEIYIYAKTILPAETINQLENSSNRKSNKKYREAILEYESDPKEDNNEVKEPIKDPDEQINENTSSEINSDIKPNKEFEKDKKDNDEEFEIPPLVNNERSFEGTYHVHNHLSSINSDVEAIYNGRYGEGTLEDFCKVGTIEEIESFIEFLNENS